ncbi:hypothetical protein B7755_040215 [Streptomyces sp. NBS 14/10]|uniref:hypothetical protein n=1 Tax=Streptomyces sp. NBS 14/10 TaxID=1945643 RepID=UPI001C52D342|nr:hypothetical protein [Streptomyces sp. NBS 14/10]KAK1183809.1 hypothetical protein B7755_040215 [Streptomyces sp. NBS 14/10]
MEGGPARRSSTGRRDGQADPDRVRPLFDRAQQELASQLAALEPVWLVLRGTWSFAAAVATAAVGSSTAAA